MKLKLEIIGNLGSDATIKEMKNGTKAIHFSVAHTDRFKNKEGKDVENTTWINCTLWRNANQGSDVANLLTKGTLVAVDGFPGASAYQNKKDQIMTSLDCKVQEVRILVKAKLPTEAV